MDFMRILPNFKLFAAYVRLLRLRFLDASVSVYSEYFMSARSEGNLKILYGKLLKRFDDTEV